MHLLKQLRRAAGSRVHDFKLKSGFLPNRLIKLLFHLDNDIRLLCIKHSIAMTQ